MEKEQAKKKRKTTPVRTFFAREKKGYKAYFVNMRFILYPAIILTVGIAVFFLLRFIGIYVSEADFVNKTNATLEAQGEASRLAMPTLGYILEKTFQGLTINADLSDMVTNMGLSDKALTDALKTEIQTSVSTHDVLAFVGFIALLVSYFLSAIVCGKKMKKANNVPYGLKYTIIGWILKTIVFGGLLTGLGYLFDLFPWASAISSLILIPLIQTLFSLWRAYMVQLGLKKTLGMFRLLTVYDAGIFLVLTFGAFFLFGVFFATLLSLFPDNAFLTISLSLPLFVYTSCFLDVYAQMYILEKAARYSPKQKEA